MGHIHDAGAPDEDSAPSAAGGASPDRLTYQAVRAASLGMFLDGFDLSIMAVALLPLRTQWRLGTGAIGDLMAAALIGSLLGGLLGGRLVDRFGRRALLLPNVALYALGAITSAASPDLTTLWLGRFVVGLAVGMDYPLVATVVAEYSAEGDRGRGFAGINIAWYLGAFTSTLLGLMLLPIGPDSWRAMLGAALLPALVLLWLRRRIPESPRWLMRRGQHEAARAALRQLHPAWGESDITHALARFSGVIRPVSVVFQKPWRRRLALSLIPWACLDIVGLGIGLYFPLVLRMQGLAHNNTAAAGINAAFLLISTAGILFIYRRLDRWGRISLQIAGFALMVAGLLLFAIGIATHEVAGVYAGSAIYSLGTGIGPGVTAMALSVEIFPTELRASAGGLATAVSRLGAAFSAILFPRLEAAWGLPMVLILMAGVSLIGAWVTRGCRIEPAGHSLEALENHGH
ncbi:MFS transporter [Acidiferrobacter sp.]|uniref:MFS transporter n=1 Tax=Acidiferrobacter sp. TaxID=1872107 RepID=UPI00260594EE|nr:MFS transporter [Acidiferrobacter sp.]